MTYEFVGTEDCKTNGQIVSLIFKDAANAVLKIAPLDFYLGQYDQDKIPYKEQTNGAVALVQKGPYPSDIPALRS